MLGLLKKVFGTAQSRLIQKYQKTVKLVNQFDELFKSLSDEELKAKKEENATANS